MNEKIVCLFNILFGKLKFVLNFLFNIFLFAIFFFVIVRNKGSSFICDLVQLNYISAQRICPIQLNSLVGLILNLEKYASKVSFYLNRSNSAAILSLTSDTLKISSLSFSITFFVNSHY